jgi:hypothetical protein
MLQYQRRIDVCEYIEEDDIFKMLSMSCNVLANDIRAWSKTKPTQLYFSRWGRRPIDPPTTIFVLDFNPVFSADFQSACSHFEAIKCFLRGTENYNIARNLVINTSVLGGNACPYYLLGPLWPCLKGMRNLEQVDLFLRPSGTWNHGLCKEYWFTPEVEKGPKIKCLTWHCAEHVNGENTCQEREVLKSVGFDDGKIDRDGPMDISKELDYFKRMAKVEELRLLNLEG